MRDPGLIDADLLRQIDLPQTRLLPLSTSMAASFFWSGELTVWVSGLQTCNAMLDDRFRAFFLCLSCETN
jgi:hypothetical protein